LRQYPKIRASLTRGILLLSSFSLNAAELRNIEVERDDNHYTMTSVSWLDVEPNALYSVLENHDLFTRFTSAVVESRNTVADGEGRPQFYSRFEGCVIVYCKSFIRNGYLELTPHTELVAIVDPDRSDFKRSVETWSLSEDDGGTIMEYTFDMEPDFWVPPVIGPFYIKRALKTGGEKAIDRIEALVWELEAAIEQGPKVAVEQEREAAVEQ
jgi:hypothetical protein